MAQPVLTPALDIQRLLGAIDWSAPNAVADARLALQSAIEQTIESLVSGAAGAGITPLTLLRNMIACAPRRALENCLIIVHGMAHRADASERIVYDRILDQLPADGYSHLAEMLLAGAVVPLDEKRFNRMPRDLRWLVMGTPILWDRLLETEFRARVRAKPDAYPGTQEHGAAFERAVASRNFAADAVRSGGRAVEASILAPLLTRAMKTGEPPFNVSPVAAPQSVRRTFEQVRPPRLRNRLLFAATSPRQRVQFFLALSPPERATVAAKASPTDWAWALLCTPTDEQLSEAAQALRSAGRYGLVLDQCTTIKAGPQRRRDALFIAWALASPERISAAIESAPAIFIRSLRTASAHESLIQFLLDCVAARPDAFGRWKHPHVLWLEKTLGGEGLAALHHVAPDRVETQLRLLVSDRPFQYASIDAFGGIVDAAVKYVPDVLPKIRSMLLTERHVHLIRRLPPQGPGTWVSPGQFALLLRSLPSATWRRQYRWFLAYSPWIKHLSESAVSGQVVVPAPLRAALHAARGTPLLNGLAALALRHPDTLGPLAVECLPLQEVLPLALRHPSIAFAVEKKYSRRLLRAQIPWARDTWSKNPLRATGYELALAFSLPDAGYLVWLARVAARRGGKERRGHAFDHLYRTFTVPKRSGGERTITVPEERLKRLQRRLLRNGFDDVPLHPAAHGFRAGRSILTNAAPHTGQELVVNLDIESFFPNTAFSAILRACGRLMRGRLSPHAVMLAADLCSLAGALPTGAPTSPAIGNIVLAPVDRALSAACRRHGIVYTRYADDLTFSGGDDAKRVIPFAEKVLAEAGYRVAEKKINLFRRGRRQMVTGLVVNDKPNIPRKVRRELRAAVHRQSTGRQAEWAGRPMDPEELSGRISFLNLVQPEEARRYRNALGRRAPDDMPGDEVTDGE